MELIKQKQSFLNNFNKDKTIQETITPDETIEYVVIDMSTWAMK